MKHLALVALFILYLMGASPVPPTPESRKWRWEVGGWEVGGWTLEVGGWRLQIRGWKLEVGSGRLEVSEIHYYYYYLRWSSARLEMAGWGERKPITSKPH